MNLLYAHAIVDGFPLIRLLDVFRVCVCVLNARTMCICMHADGTFTCARSVC